MQKPKISKNSKFHQGVFTPRNPSKYIGSYPIIFRSSWEFRFMIYCDSHPSVIEWSSEIPITYKSTLDGKIHTYFIDFYIKINDQSGIIKKKLIEIKPHKETKEPVRPKNKRGERKYLEEVITYQKNLDKWRTVVKISQKSGMTFEIFDEYRLGIKKKPSI
jgi:hypothetical protein